MKKGLIIMLPGIFFLVMVLIFLIISISIGNIRPITLYGAGFFTLIGIILILLGLNKERKRVR